jgi:hypothetical protein
MEGETLRFIVDIPADAVIDVLRMDEAEETIAGGISHAMLADALRNIIIAGFEGYTEEEVEVCVRPVKSATKAS